MADVVAIQGPHAAADLNVFPEGDCSLEVAAQVRRVGVALVLGDPLGVARLLARGEKRGDRKFAGEVADACRVPVPCRHELLRAGDMDAFDQLVLRMGRRSPGSGMPVPWRSATSSASVVVPKIQADSRARDVAT